MNIFGGRPGVSAGVLAVIAILAAFYFIKAAIFALFACAVLLLITLAILCACGYIKPYRMFASAFVIIIFCTSLLRGFGIFEHDIPHTASFEGENRYVHATVIERRRAADYFAVFLVRLHSIDGVECEEKAILNCEYNSGFQVGYEIVLRGTEISSTLSLEDEDAYDLLSEEIFLAVLSEDENDSAVISKNNLSFADKCKSLNLLCSAKLKNSIKGDAGKLAAAMLLGDKSAIPSQIYRDFSRSGLSHYLAVSGLHVSIITGIVSFLLLKIRIKRTYRNLFIGLFAVAYLCLLGFPVSAVRSVAMLLTVFLAYSLGDSSDALNALGLAAAGITLANPCSVFDKSFILSFCATLGIVAFVPVFYSLTAKIFEPRKEEKSDGEKRTTMVLRKGFSFLFGTLLSISAALSMTLLPVMYFFGEISILSFKSNLAASVAAMPLLASSLFYLILGGAPFIGTFLKGIVQLSSGYMISLAAKLSDTRGALVSLVHEESQIIVFVFSTIVFAVLIIKLKHKKPLLAIPALYPAILAGLVLISVSSRPSNAEFEILSLNGSEVIGVTQGADTAIVDISEGNLSPLRIIYELVNDKGVTEIDTLMLTHYHSKHLSSVSRFMSEIKVRRLLLARPQNENDAWIMAQLAKTANSLGVIAEMLPEEGSTELIGGIFVDHSGIERIERSNAPVFSISFSDGEERITYLSESSWESDGALRTHIDRVTASSDYVLIGEQGPIVKKVFDIPLNNARSISLLGECAVEYFIHSESSLKEITDTVELGVCRKSIYFGK